MAGVAPVIAAPATFVTYITPLLESVKDKAPFLAVKDTLGLNIFFLTAVGAWGIFLGYLKNSYNGDMDSKWAVNLGISLAVIACVADFLWEFFQDAVYIFSADLPEPDAAGVDPEDLHQAENKSWRKFLHVARSYNSIYWMV